MRKSVILMSAALVALCVVGFASIQVARAQDGRSYVWYGELVSVDPAAKTMTVKAPVKDPVMGYVSQFKPGDKVVMIWDLIATVEGDTVLYLAKSDVMKSSNVNVGYILPAEFVSADTAGKTITFKTVAPDSVKSMQPGQWIKVTMPMSQPGESAVIASVQPSAGGRPKLAARPAPAPEVVKITSPQDYARAMKELAGAFGTANKAIGSGALNDAKGPVANARAQMLGVQGFWMEKKKDDPAAIAKDAVAKLDVLQKALAGADAAAAAAAVKDVGGTCGACHGKYREQDPTTKAFKFKEGTL